MLHVPPLHGRYYNTYCGASTLKLLGEYYGISRSVERWAGACECIPPEGFGAPIAGCSGEQILSGAKKMGFEGFINDHSTLADARHYLKQNIPPVVDWFTEDFYFNRTRHFIDTEGCDGHYSLIVNAGEKKGERVILRDARCKQLIRFSPSDFLRVWFDFTGNSVDHDLSNIILRRMIILYPAGMHVRRHKVPSTAR
jgi:hypothetical protein